MEKDNTKGIITAIKAYTKKFKMDTEPYCAQISRDGDKFKLITPELSMILKDNVLSYDNDIILNAGIPFHRYHFKTMFPVININNVMCDTDLLTDKIRKLERLKSNLITKINISGLLTLTRLFRNLQQHIRKITGNT